MNFHICLLVLTAARIVLSIKTNGTRIVGGIVSPTFIPYQTALYINNQFGCGGSLITSKCVLTAAHCVNGHRVTAFKVRAGVLKLSSTSGTSRKVAQAFLPAEYNRITLNNDVAILKLKTRLTGKNVGTIALNNVTLEVGDQLKVSGWGKTTENSQQSDELRYVEVPAISWGTCNTQYGGALTKSMFCAASSGKDACLGDSGGPVVKDNRVYGIVSWGFGCGRANYAGVYTSVQQVLPWIKSITQKHC